MNAHTAENGLLPIEECIEPEALIEAMIHAGAWAVIEASMDTADREPPRGLYEQTVADVRSWLTDKVCGAWDDGNAVGLDGWIGPGRGVEPDDEGIRLRERYIARVFPPVSTDGSDQ